jgi:hypothetical protein
LENEIHDLRTYPPPSHNNPTTETKRQPLRIMHIEVQAEQNPLRGVLVNMKKGIFLPSTEAKMSWRLHHHLQAFQTQMRLMRIRLLCTVPNPDLDFRLHGMHSIDLMASMELLVYTLHLLGCKINMEVPLVNMKLQNIR